MTRRTLYIIASIYFFTVLGFIIFPPTVNMINTIEPRILGFPCFQFFILFVSVLMGVGLLAWFWLEDRIDQREGLESGGEKDE